MITDHDVGVEGLGAVSSWTVARVFAENEDKLRKLLLGALPRIGPQPEDACATALAKARI